ncbi:MAG: hypothetical protein RBR09_10100 [Desulfobulbaceae bacterium]|nr:hypothetical protein [Desulfobulbaceae bacterium]
MKKFPDEQVMLVVGCVPSRAKVGYLQQEIADFHIPEETTCFEPLGAGLWAL